MSRFFRFLWPRKGLALITSERLPRSTLSYEQRETLYATLESQLSDDALRPILVLDFLRRDLLVPAERFSAFLLTVARPSLPWDTLNALWHLHARAVVARDHGASLALTRTNAWNGVIEANQRVYLDF